MLDCDTPLGHPHAARKGGDMASERQGGGETDAAELPPVPRKRDAAVAERDRLQLGNVGRRLAVPKRIGTWSLTSLRQRLMKTGGRLVNHAAVLLAAVGGRLPMSRGPRATMAGCGEESHMERRCRPAVMEGEAVMPAPAAVKGSVHGPLRALDRGSRRHHLANMTAGQT